MESTVTNLVNEAVQRFVDEAERRFGGGGGNNNERKLDVVAAAKKKMKPKKKPAIFKWIEDRVPTYNCNKFDSKHVVYKGLIIDKKSETVVGVVSSDGCNQGAVDEKAIDKCETLGLQYTSK
jgi:hypothetical protein